MMMTFITSSPLRTCSWHKSFALGSKTSCESGKATTMSAAQKIAVPRRIATVVTALAASASLTLLSSHAVSGGGKDYASQNLAGQTFHGSYAGKDFSGGLFRGCDFAGSDLTNTRFFKAELREADMTGANLSYATIEAAILRDTNLNDAIMVGSYISDSILDAASIENADFSDALISPESAVVKLCERTDAKGVNSSTGVSTRESLMCPE